MAGKLGRSGRRPQVQQDNIRDLLDKYFKPEARQKVLAKVIEMAEQKNLEAVKLLWSYCYGKAPETINLNGGLAVKVIYDKRGD
jgi:hypothetical protein